MQTPKGHSNAHAVYTKLFVHHYILLIELLAQSSCCESWEDTPCMQIDIHSEESQGTHTTDKRKQQSKGATRTVAALVTMVPSPATSRQHSPMA